MATECDRIGLEKEAVAAADWRFFCSNTTIKIHLSGFHYEKCEARLLCRDHKTGPNPVVESFGEDGFFLSEETCFDPTGIDFGLKLE